MFNGESNKLAVVVIAYNRLTSIQRLIKSLVSADYLGEKVDLFISIDNSGNSVVADYANQIEWAHGELKIIVHQVRLGLKAHVLSCGSLVRDYDAVCVFEDDLYASPGYYTFAKQALLHFKELNGVAGISLYAHSWNPYVNRPFIPVNDGYDVFFLQVASSWGQIWSRASWSKFVKWMESRVDDDLHSDCLPKEVSNWSAKSWLKYHNKYLVDTNQFFVYPRESLSTNFSDTGEHAIENTVYQVPILTRPVASYRFPSTLEDGVQYDAFFENRSYANTLGLREDQLDVNFYGNREKKKRYLLTIERLGYKVVTSFGMKLRPIDLNVLLSIEGEGIYLYDTTVFESNRMRRFSKIAKLLYDMRISSKKDLLLAVGYLYLMSLLKKFGVKS